MALLTNWLEEQNKKTQNNTPSQFQMASGIQGGAAGRTGGVSGNPLAGPKTVDQGTKKGSGFTNLSSFFDANKNEGTRMATGAADFEKNKGLTAATKLKQDQDKYLSDYDKNFATKDFDEKMLAGDVTKMSPEQLALFKQNYGGDVSSFDNELALKNKNFDVAQNEVELGEYDKTGQLYGDTKSRASQLVDVFGKGRGDYKADGKMSLLDSFLMGQKGGDMAKAGALAGKDAVTGQLTGGETARVGKLTGLKDKQIKENQAVKGTYDKLFGDSESALAAAQKVEGPKYETFNTVDTTDQGTYLTANKERDRVLAENRKAYDDYKAKVLSGAGVQARRNALAGLTGKAATNVDFNKMLAAYAGDKNVGSAILSDPKARSISEGINAENPFDNKSATNVSNVIADEAMRAKDQYHTAVTDPAQAVENKAVDTKKKAKVASTEVQKAHEEPLKQLSNAVLPQKVLKFDRWGLPYWESTGGSSGGGSSSSGGGSGSYRNSRGQQLK